MYKEDDDLEENYLEEKYNQHEAVQNLVKTKKEDIRQLQEFVTIKKPKDPFRDLEPLR